MVNGHGNPNCVLCENYKDYKSRRNCLKHNFVMPKVGYDILCKDYRHKIRGAGLDCVEQLDADALYYYYDSFYEKLDLFVNIQELVIGARIKKLDNCYDLENNNLVDLANAYIIEVRDYNSHYLPSIGVEVVIKSGSFNWSAVVRKVSYRGSEFKSIDNVILTSSCESYAYDWLCCHFDMSYVFKKYSKEKYLHADLGFPVFLKVYKLQNFIILMPDYLHFRYLYGLASIRDEKYIIGR